MYAYKKLEQIVKGFSNHRRLEVMLLLDKQPDLSVEDIVCELQINYKTASVHIQRLSMAGMISKRYQARNVRHRLTPRGTYVLTFLRKLE